MIKNKFVPSPIKIVLLTILLAYLAIGIFIVNAPPLGDDQCIELTLACQYPENKESQICRRDLEECLKGLRTRKTNVFFKNLIARGIVVLFWPAFLFKLL